MVVRMLLVLLTLTGLVPAGDCMCASAHHASDSDTSGELDSVTLSPIGDHDHDDSHPIHHHPTCPALNPQLGPPVALAPVPFSSPAPPDCALTVWGSWSVEPSPLSCRIHSVSRPSAPALPLYLSQSTLQI